MLAVTTVAVLMGGCSARLGRLSVDVDGSSSYRPATYDDRVVYYDDGGQPYYYSGSAIVYVQRTDVRYVGLTNHYREHRVNYHRWYHRDGRRHPQHPHR